MSETPIRKALFIPLKTEYFEAFAAGTKTKEYRLYGPRWNEKTVAIGRMVTLSHGYSSKRRLYGVVSKATLMMFPDRFLPGFKACYPKAGPDAVALVIGITLFSLIPCSEAESKEHLRNWALPVLNIHR